MVFVWGFAFQLGYFHGRISGVDSAPRYSDGRIDWAYQSPRVAAAGQDHDAGRAVRADRAGVLRAVPGLDGRGARRGLEHGAADAVHHRADDLPGRGRRADPARRSCTRSAGAGLFARATAVFTRFALPLFLFHTTGMALSRGGRMVDLRHPGGGHRARPEWWLLRPVAIIGPLLATLPVIYLFGRRWETQTVAPPPRILPIEDEEVGDGGDPPLITPPGAQA